MKRGTKDEPDSDPEAPPERRSRPQPKADALGRGLRDSARTSDVREAIDRTGEVAPGFDTGERDRPLDSPGPDRVLATVLELARRVSLEMHDEEIVSAYVAALSELFPGRRFAVRLVSPETGRLSLAHATGKLIDERRTRPEVTREALVRHGIDAPKDGSGVGVADSWRPLFEPGATGFDVPMVDGDRVVGVLGVEYPPGRVEPPGDRHVAVPIGLQLGAALRNARLLRESRYLRDYLGKLLDHANAPIVVIGRHREIRVANRAFLAVTGMEREHLLGRDFVEFMPEQDRARLLPVFISALRGESATNFEVRLPRHKAGYARVAFNTASMLNPAGEVEAVIAIGRDLTEVRELEEQIIQAEKLATLGQLAAGVVHELNNPLTSISVYSDYLLRKLDGQGADDRDLEKLRRIAQSAERILNFTRDLVTYARPNTEQPRLVSMHAVLEQSIVFCEHVLEEAGARVVRTYGDRIPLVYAVEGQLHQVFINLITNACHAMPDGAGVLRIDAEPVAEAHVAIRLGDNGSGIPTDQLDKVFEPFFSTKGEGKGTGLGLSIVRNIVQQHNGSIRVDSQIGTGTTFEILLPCQPQRRSEHPRSG